VGTATKRLVLIPRLTYAVNIREKSLLIARRRSSSKNSH